MCVEIITLDSFSYYNKYFSQPIIYFVPYKSTKGDQRVQGHSKRKDTNVL